MIYVKLMGDWGIGNQMFSYAFGRAISLKTGEPLTLYGGSDIDGNRRKKAIERLRISNTVKIINDYTDIPGKNLLDGFLWKAFQYLLGGFGARFPNAVYTIFAKIQPYLNKHGLAIMRDGYVDIQYYNRNKDMLCYGYFQSEKYFKEYREIIKDELRVKDLLEEKMRKYLERIEASNSVCIHVRRGDYLKGRNAKVYNICTRKYYREAITFLTEAVSEIKLFVFSNDINWCKKNMEWPLGTVFVEGGTVMDDLQLMSACKHFIISNSTFCWWAQYLGDFDKKIVVAPSRWTGVAYPCDIMLNNWKLIDV